MDKFIFWKKKKNPADASAQHLANLLGTSVAGFAPQPPNDKVDLNIELFIRNNVAIASLVILSGLIKGNASQREWILKSIKPKYLGEKSFENYLFGIISSQITDEDNISIPAIEKKISQYSLATFGEPSDKRSLRGDSFRWTQILDFDPTDAQLKKAVEHRRNWADKQGLFDQEN